VSGLRIVGDLEAGKGEGQVRQKARWAATKCDLDYLRSNGLCSICREPLTDKEKTLEGVGGSYVRCNECVAEYVELAARRLQQQSLFACGPDDVDESAGLRETV
jgi:hypothetical protein